MQENEKQKTCLNKKPTYFLTFSTILPSVLFFLSLFLSPLLSLSYSFNSIYLFLVTISLSPFLILSHFRLISFHSLFNYLFPHCLSPSLQHLLIYFSLKRISFQALPLPFSCACVSLINSLLCEANLVSTKCTMFC